MLIVEFKLPKMVESTSETIILANKFRPNYVTQIHRIN